MGERRELDMLTLCVLLTAVVGLTSGQCEDTFPDGTPCGQNDFVQQEDPELCYKYYKCDSGCVTHETCPGDFKYDTLYGFCNYPSDVDCGSRPCPDGDVHCPPPLTPTTAGATGAVSPAWTENTSSVLTTRTATRRCLISSTWAVTTTTSLTVAAALSVTSVIPTVTTPPPPPPP